MGESVYHRACVDTEKFRKDSRAFFWGVEVVGSGVSSSLTAWLLWDKSALHGWQVALITFAVFVVGLFIIYVIIFLWNLFRAPYRQRNELRKQIEQLAPSSDSKYYEQIAKDASVKHWEDLILLSQEIDLKLDTPFTIDNRYSKFPKERRKEADGIHELMRINHWEELDYETSPDYVESAIKADWSLYDCLQTHLKAEDPEWENKMAILKDATVTLHQKLYALAQVATGITKKWSIVLAGGWSTSPEMIKGGKLSSKLQVAIVPMNNEVMKAIDNCWEAIKPIKEKLHIIARRRTFHGQCPACPD